MSATLSHQCRVALALAKRGYHVLVLAERSKIPPDGSHGLHDATRDPKVIERLFTANPRGNLGIACAASRVVCLDVDHHTEEADGAATLAALEAELGKLPETVEALTGSGGRHLYFTAPAGAEFRGALGPGLDIRYNAYCVCPDSVHPDTGNKYRWLRSPLDEMPAELPALWLERMKKPAAPVATTPAAFKPCTSGGTPWGNKGRADELETLRTAPVTTRNRMANKVAFNLAQLHAGGELPDVREEIFAACVANGLVRDDGERKTRASIESGWSAGLKEPRSAPRKDRPTPNTSKTAPAATVAPGQTSAAPTETPAKLTFRSTDAIPEEPITWLWQQQLALAVATLWSADPGIGKTLLALDIVAHVSSGRRLPGNAFVREPADVLLINYEDDLAKSIVPRLRAAGADLSRVHALDFATSEITLPEAWADIATEIARWKAELVIVDPIQAFFSRDLSSNNDSDVRKALRDGVTVARAHNCAMLWIRHCNKLQNVGALAKGGGSIGFTGIVRHEAMLGQAEEDPDGRIIACVKSNLSRKPPSRAFKIVEEGGVPRIEWGDTCATSADDLARASGRQDKGADAAVLLQEALSAGPRRQKEIEALAKEKHLGWRTVQAAKKALDVKSQKLDGAWWWTLPPATTAALHPCALSTPCVVPLNNNNYLDEEGCNTATPQGRNDVEAPSALRPSLTDEDPEVIS